MPASDLGLFRDSPIIWSKKQVGATVSAVQEIIETFSADLPNGLEIITWDDWSKYYDQHMAMLTGNAVAGFILVFIILALTLHLRFGLVGQWRRPDCHFRRFPADADAGVPLNTYTITALILILCVNG